MLWTRYFYKWYSLTDEDGFITKIIVEDNEKKATIRSNTYAFANNFWSVAWPRLAESRLYSFEWYIMNLDSYIRETRRSELCRVFKIESNQNIERFFPLNRQTKFWEPRTAQAMVYDPLEATNEMCDPEIKFKFSLLAQDPRIYDPRPVTLTWWLWQYWAWPLWHILPYEEWWIMFSWWIECIHEWDRDAPMSIRIIWNVVNPKVLIIKDNQIMFHLKLQTTTTDLLIDNTNTSAIDTNERFIIKDWWNDVSNFVDINDDISTVFIPWTEYWWSKTSYVVVLADNYAEAKDSTSVIVSYRHTYSH